MTEDKNYTNTPQEEDELEIELMEYVRKLWKARMLLVKVAGVAAIIGLVIAYSIPKKYTAEITLAPESAKGGGNMSGMAAMLGLPTSYLSGSVSGNDWFADSTPVPP